MAINGRSYDWESVSIQGPQGQLVAIQSIDYEDGRGVKPRYGKGAVPRAYGRENYEASGSLSLDREEYERLRSAMGGSVYKGEPVTITVSYGDDGMETVTDTLPDVVFTKSKTGAKQGEAEAGVMEMDMVILSPIKWSGEAAY